MDEIRNNDRFGINMRRWCKEHEAYLIKAMAQEDDPSALLEWHEKKLGWLQHERLIHLIVLFLVTVGELFLIAILFLVPQIMPWSLLLMYVVLVVFIFYIRHYFFLENTVQHWYRLSEELHDKISDLK